MNESRLWGYSDFVLLCPDMGSRMTAREAFDRCVEFARTGSKREIAYELAELSSPSGEYVAICRMFGDSTEVVPSSVIQACDFGIDDRRFPVRRMEYVRHLVC